MTAQHDVPCSCLNGMQRRNAAIAGFAGVSVLVLVLLHGIS